MIAFIKGTIVSVGADSIVIDHDGMGWELYYPHVEKVHSGETAQIYTYLQILENDMHLYGFESMQEKSIFLKLISVKGIGPKTAINILHKAGSNELINAIETGDVKFLKTMPGIGAKAASQIVLDLKGNLIPVDTPQEKKSLPQEIQYACEALKSFGYRESEISKAVHIMKEKEGLTTQAYLKLGLQYLSKQALKG